MKTSESIKNIAEAMSKFQGSIDSVKQESENPYFKSKYSDLNSIWSAIRADLSYYGLSVIQEAQTLDVGVSVTTMIMHSSGEFLEFAPLTVFLGKKDAHSVGSACSYAKRYSLCAALGVVTTGEDDDANRAQYTGPAKGNIEKKVTPEQIKELQKHLEKNKELHENVVSYMMNKFNTTDLKEMPVQLYQYTLDKAKQAPQKENNDG